MVKFEDIFTDDKIIAYLCKLRVKVAKQRNKKHLLHLFTNNKKYNYHLPVDHKSEFEKEFAEEFYPLFPPRKSWKQLGRDSRYRKKGGGSTKISTLDKNQESLIKTINFYRAKHPTAPCVVALNTFILDIKGSINDANYAVHKPYTYPKAKDKKKENFLKEGEYNVCRPLSLFKLKDKLILSFTNNYLTKILDRYFEPCSLAFRATRYPIVNHHTAIQHILKYKSQHTNENLWVVECDMQKFFDTVDHKVIRQQFDLLLSKLTIDYPELEFISCTNIFYSYLKCYCFNQDVLHRNSDEAHWTEYKIPKGQYGWIQKDIEKLKLYENILKERIGIPQGGALSGLIANIVLDIADKKILENNQGAFYTRFCDDMIIMHPDKNICEAKIKIYLETLHDCNLVVHPFTDKLKQPRHPFNKRLPSITLKSFWKGKSKGPYKWGDVLDGGFPWIGFVGYEMHFNGDIRVRESSLIKELKKQKKIIEDIKGAIKEQLKVGKGTITESAMKKLVGMSVSRVELWNFSTVPSEMCWKNGFQELNVNPHSIKQMKRLDKSRSKLYYKLIKETEKIVTVRGNNQNAKEEPRERQIVSYDKPFSYYYHMIEKSK